MPLGAPGLSNPQANLGTVGSGLRESDPQQALSAWLGGVQGLPPMLRRLLEGQLGGIQNRYNMDVSGMIDSNPGGIPTFQDWLSNTFGGSGGGNFSSFLEGLTPGILSQGRQFGQTTRKRLI